MGNRPEEKEQEYENFRAYHSLQYDRMDKLESRREVFSSLVLTASLGLITFAFTKDSQLNTINLIVLALTMVFANWIAIQFSEKTYNLFKMHQDRAKEARNVYAPELNEINDRVYKPDGPNDWLSRPKLYKMLHRVTIGVIFVALFSTLFLDNRHEKKEVREIVKIISNKPTSTTVVSRTVSQ